MAHVLNIVHGSTTLALASGNYALREYAMQTKIDKDAVSVEETIVIQVSGSSLANLQANLHAIENAIRYAGMYQNGETLDRVFIQLQGSGEASLWQSEILSGRVILPSSALLADWASNIFDVTIIISRAPFWEATEWTALSLTNPNGTNLTNGIRVFSFTDGSGSSPNIKCNYVDVNAAEVTGSLPAPVKFVITPSYDFDKIYIGHQHDLAGMGLLNPYIEMEDMSGWTNQYIEAASSGGKYVNKVMTAATWEAIGQWIDFNDYPSRMHRIFLRDSDSQATNWPNGLKVQVTFSNSLQAMHKTPVITKSSAYNKLLPLGDIRLPPGRRLIPKTADLKDFQVVLKFYYEDDWILFLDTLYWMPLDSWLELGSTIDVVNLTTDTLYYSNDLQHMLYVTASGEARNIFDIVRGDGIWLQPEVDNRIHFLVDGFEISHYLTVQAWYKPRRSTI